MGELKRNWGSLDVAFLSLFQVLSGLGEWATIIDPLSFDGLLLLTIIVFIIIVQFAFLNVITGVFCQSAIESAAKDRELLVGAMLQSKKRYIEALVQQFSKLSNELGMTQNEISFESLEVMSHHNAVREYFALLELNVTDAGSLFDLLDKDGNGKVTIHEFIEGCFNLKGNARSIDLMAVSLDVKHIRDNLKEEIENIRTLLEDALTSANGVRLVTATSEPTSPSCASVGRTSFSNADEIDDGEACSPCEVSGAASGAGTGIGGPQQVLHVIPVAGA